MRNILITGSTGYLGRRLAAALRQKDQIGEIVGIDIQPPTNPAEGVTFYKKDIRDPDIGGILSRHRIDTLFHLAFVVQPVHDIRRMHDIDLNGSQNILESARTAGVSHVLVTSSTLAYGAHPDNPPLLSETHPLRGNRTFPYGYYKAVTDEMIQRFAGANPQITVTILRPCTVFGPSIDNYISRMLFMPATVRAAGYNPPVQFVHEDDFVAACLAAMSAEIGGAFNITGDGTVTVDEIAGIIGTRVLPVPAWILYPMIEALWRLHCPGIEVNRGYLDYVRYPFVTSNQKAKEKLGVYPGYSSRETVAATAGRHTNAQSPAKSQT